MNVISGENLLKCILQIRNVLKQVLQKKFLSLFLKVSVIRFPYSTNQNYSNIYSEERPLSLTHERGKRENAVKTNSLKLGFKKIYQTNAAGNPLRDHKTELF